MTKTHRQLRELYLERPPALCELTKTAEYPVLQAYFKIVEKVQADKERNLPDLFLEKKYKCKSYEYKFIKYIINNEYSIDDIFKMFLESRHNTLRMYIMEVTNQVEHHGAINSNVLEKAFSYIDKFGKNLYKDEKTKTVAFIWLDKIRNKVNNIIPKNAELSEFDWFVNYNCVACDSEPEPITGNHVVKDKHGIPIPLCKKCYDYYKKCGELDIVDDDNVKSMMWKYIKKLEDYISIIDD